MGLFDKFFKKTRETNYAINNTQKELEQISSWDAIELAPNLHTINDEFIGYTYKVNQSFKYAKSHAGEVELLCTYSPNTAYGEEGTVPYIALQFDDPVFCAVDEYKENGTFEGVIEISPLSGRFLFKAKQEYFNNMMYFYGFEEEDGFAGLCLVYPKEMVGTDDEFNLMQVLDEAAESFKQT